MDYVIEADFEQILARVNVKSPFLDWDHFKILQWKENLDQYNGMKLTIQLTNRVT